MKLILGLNEKHGEKGWFWFCPIYWEGKTQTLSPRLVPVFVLEFTLWIHHSMITLAALCGIEIEEGYPIKLVKEPEQ